MSAVLRVTGEDLRYLATRVNALADDVHSFPFRGVNGMPGCGSGRVAEAAEGANAHFELRSLLIETELRDIADMAAHVDSTMTRQDQGLASGGPNRVSKGIV